jgi:8-oxo-dGTP pyrophosphatase MutT (NUDIX family)
MDELHEEIGLSAHHILLPPQLFAIVIDHEDGVIDLAYCIRTPARADEIAAFVGLRPREHEEICVVPLQVFLDELERGSLSLSDAGLAIAGAARRAGLFDAGH